MRLHLTLFRTVEESVGRATSITASTAEEFAVGLQAFLQATNRDYQLWQGAAFKNNHRSSDDFLEAGLITVDADYGIDLDRDHVVVPSDVEHQIGQALRQGHLRATLGHTTPRGLRVIHLLRDPITTVDHRRRAGLGAMQLIQEHLRGLGLLANLGQGQAGYSLDVCTQKAAQAMWLPNFDAFGGRRQSEVILIPGADGLPQLFDSHQLADLAPISSNSPPAPPLRALEEQHSAGRSGQSTSLERAVLRFNERHAIDFVALRRTCPACRHSDCFNQVPGSGDLKWFCHSSNHGRDSSRRSAGPCGRRTPDGFVGDALDLAAHARGLTRIQLLLDEGLLARRRGRRRTLTFRLGE